MEDRDTIINFIHPAPKPLSGSKLEKYGNLEGVHSSLIYVVSSALECVNF